MNQEQVLDEFRAAGALLEGHFILTSGLHSPAYLQCARLMMDPARAARVCAALAVKVKDHIPAADGIDYVVSPAMGGVVVGYEIGRQLGRPAIFVERVDGRFIFKRFELAPQAKCLMVEDIVTTGLSSRECIEVIEAHGGKVLGAACLVDRSNGKADIGVPLAALAKLEIPNYAEHELPPELAAIDAVKPGSRDAAL